MKGKKIMKYLLGILMLAAAFAYTARAQVEPKIAADFLASGSTKVVKGAPFSAEAITESVQVLADGNRIARSVTTKMYRDGEGRFRREEVPGAGGSVGSIFAFQSMTSITDPVANVHYYLNPASKTVRRIAFSGTGEFGAVPMVAPGNRWSTRTADDAAHAKIEAVRTGTGATAVVTSGTAPNAVTTITTTDGVISTVTVSGSEKPAPLGGQAVFGVGRAFGGNVPKTENLGIQKIEGVDAEGTRTVTTIPAGAIGNERPIEIVYERWYSKDLQMIVMSKHSDPRYGDQTYRLVNINRSEPDHSLFAPPSDYKIIIDTISGRE
jgi:hypothetical protein